MKIAVFGATGQAGRQITRLLLEDPSVEVTACARKAAKLERLEGSMRSAAGTLETVAVDLASDSAVDDVASSVDLVVGATGRWSDGPRFASLAVRRRSSYFGIYLSSPEKWRRLRPLAVECADAGLMVVDDGGVHPGLPAAMIRWIASEVPLSAAWVGAKFGLRWGDLDLSPETIADFAEEMWSTDPSVLVEGEWVQGYRYARKFDFGDGRGSESCVPMCLEEIRELALAGTVASSGFFIAGFGPLVDYAVFPLGLGLSKLSPPLGSRLLWWGLRRFGSSTPRATLMLQAVPASGRAPIRVRVSHPDPYALTAAAAVASIRQMMSGPRPGVWTQAGFVRPIPFFEDLDAMGVRIDRSDDAL